MRGYTYNYVLSRIMFSFTFKKTTSFFTSVVYSSVETLNTSSSFYLWSLPIEMSDCSSTSAAFHQAGVLFCVLVSGSGEKKRKILVRRESNEI